MTKISDLTALTGASVDDAVDLLPIVDMSETGAARNKKITIDETRIALGLSSADSPQFTGLNLGHATDTTITRVSAGVVAIEGVNIVTTAGGVTFAADITVPDEAYDATAWNGSLEVPTKNAVRDKIESLAAGSGVDVEDEGVAVATATVLNFTGAGVVATDAGAGQVDVTIAGGGGGVDIEDEGVAEATGATVLNFTGAGVTATDVGAGQVDIDIPGGSGSAWALAGTGQTATGVYDFAVDGAKATVDFVGLAGAQDILILNVNTTLGTTGVLSLHLSVDNGSTFYSTSGDYLSLASTGVGTNTTVAAVAADTNSTAARSGGMRVHAANVNGTPKSCEGMNASANRQKLFVASTSPVNAVRVIPTGGGNVTGGKIYCVALI